MAQSDPPGPQPPPTYKKPHVNTADNTVVKGAVSGPSVSTLTQNGVKRPYVPNSPRTILSSDDGRSVTSGGFSSEAPSSTSSKRKCCVCKKHTPFDAKRLLCCAICRRAFHRACSNTRIETDPWRCGNCETKAERQSHHAHILRPAATKGVSLSSTPPSWSPVLLNLSPSTLASPRVLAHDFTEQLRPPDAEFHKELPHAVHTTTTLSKHAMSVDESTNNEVPHLDRDVAARTTDRHGGSTDRFPSPQSFTPLAVPDEMSPMVPAPVARMVPPALGINASSSSSVRSTAFSTSMIFSNESLQGLEGMKRLNVAGTMPSEVSEDPDGKTDSQPAATEAPVVTHTITPEPTVNASDPELPMYDMAVRSIHRATAPQGSTSINSSSLDESDEPVTSNPQARSTKSRDRIVPLRLESEMRDHITVLTDDTSTSQKGRRPDYSYRELTEAALLQAPDHRLHSRQVLEWICSNIPGYTPKDQDLKCGIHNVLSQTARKPHGNICSEEPKASDPKHLKWWFIRPGREKFVRPWDESTKSIGKSMLTPKARSSTAGSHTNESVDEDSGGNTKRKQQRGKQRPSPRKDSGASRSLKRSTTMPGPGSNKMIDLGPSVLKEGTRKTDLKRETTPQSVERPSKRIALTGPTKEPRPKANGEDSQSVATSPLSNGSLVTGSKKSLNLETQNVEFGSSEAARLSKSAIVAASRIMGTFTIDDDDSDEEPPVIPTSLSSLEEPTTNGASVVQAPDSAGKINSPPAESSEKRVTLDQVQDSYPDDAGALIELPDTMDDQPTRMDNAILDSNQSDETTPHLEQVTQEEEIGHEEHVTIPAQPSSLAPSHLGSVPPVELSAPPADQTDIEMTLDSSTPPSLTSEPTNAPSQISAERALHNSQVLSAIRNRQRQIFPTLASIQLPKPPCPVPLAEIESRPSRKRIMRAGPEWSRLGHNTALERMEIVNASIQRSAPPRGPLNPSASTDGVQDLDLEGTDHGFGMGYGNLSSSQEAERYDNLDDLLGVPAKVAFKVQDGQLVVVDAGATSRGSRGRLTRVKNVFRTGYVNRAR